MRNKEKRESELSEIERSIGDREERERKWVKKGGGGVDGIKMEQEKN